MQRVQIHHDHISFCTLAKPAEVIAAQILGCSQRCGAIDICIGRTDGISLHHAGEHAGRADVLEEVGREGVRSKNNIDPSAAVFCKGVQITAAAPDDDWAVDNGRTGFLKEREIVAVLIPAPSGSGGNMAVGNANAFAQEVNVIEIADGALSGALVDQIILHLALRCVQLDGAVQPFCGILRLQ